MDNDKFDQYEARTENSSRYQELDPRRFYEPPGYRGASERQGTPGRQGMPGREGLPERQDVSGFANMPLEPPSGPPNFTPDMQRYGARPFSFGSEEAPQSRMGGQNQHRDFRRCLNRFTFIWLNNGNNFWFYPTGIRRQQVEGFRWRNNRWFFDRINMRRILFFRCF